MTTEALPTATEPDDPVCGKCAEPESSLTHAHPSTCRELTGWPCAAPGLHHPFEPRQPELVNRALWGDR